MVEAKHRFKMPNSAPPIAEDFSSEPKREFVFRFREPKPMLLSNREGERETFSERLVQVIWRWQGIVILVPPAHDAFEFVIGAIPYAPAEGVAYALGRESPPIRGD
jgi:hypothetical protein